MDNYMPDECEFMQLLWDGKLNLGCGGINEIWEGLRGSQGNGWIDGLCMSGINQGEYFSVCLRGPCYPYKIMLSTN
jgi:hypothetical protein